MTTNALIRNSKKWYRPILPFLPALVLPCVVSICCVFHLLKQKSEIQGQMSQDEQVTKLEARIQNILQELRDTKEELEEQKELEVWIFHLIF